MTDSTLEVIKNRRSIPRFETTPIEDNKIQAILEAGRWAPSYINSQPWSFIVVKDPDIKETLSDFSPTIYKKGVREAPLCIVVSVNPEEDPFHFIEDGAAATQNMALAAQSLGLGSCWIGTFRLEKEEGSLEEEIKKVLDIPKKYRVISLLPIGVPTLASKYPSELKRRKPLSQIVYQNKFGKSK